MPNSSRNGFREYNKEHIENSIFDIDKNSNKKNKLPHAMNTKIGIKWFLTMEFLILIK